MEIRLKRAEFLSELGPMQGIVERRTTIPVLSHILLRAEDDRLSLAATDLDVSLTSWCEAEVVAPGGIAGHEADPREAEDDEYQRAQSEDGEADARGQGAHPARQLGRHADCVS